MPQMFNDSCSFRSLYPVIGRVSVGIFLMLVTSPLLAQWTNVGVGIDYQKVTITMNDGKNNNLFLSRMTASNTNCIINSMIASQRVAGAREKPSAMATRMEDAINYWGESWGQRNDVIVAINGSFENTSTATIAGGDYYDGWCAKRFDDWSGQMGFIWRMDRSYYMGVCARYKPGDQTLTVGGVSHSYDGINIVRTNDQLIIYTPQYNNNTLTDNSGVEVLVEMSGPLVYLDSPAPVTGTIRQVRVGQGSTRIPFDHIVLSGRGTSATYLQNNAQVGQPVQIYQHLLKYDGPTGNLCSSADNRSFVKTYGLAQGNFHFLKNSQVIPTDNTGMIVRRARTFVAYNATNVFFGVCDERSGSVGMTSDEMGWFCLTNLLATEAVNMDGGGSSVMVVNGAIKNSPTDGSERSVVNGLMMVNVKPKLTSTAYASGQSVKTTASANFRLGPGTDYFSFMTLANGAQGTVLSHQIGGVYAKGFYWWQCDFGGTNGWIAESTLAASATPPFLVLQPSNRVVATGGSTNFTVVATGSSPLHFQWQKNLTNLINGGHYSGCTNATLTITGADSNDVASFRCVVTNTYGSTNSVAVTLSIVNPPATPVASAASAVTSSGFTANWGSAALALGYRLDISTTNTFASFVPGYQNLDVGNMLNRVVSGLGGGVTCYYRVRAYNNDGTSGNSGTISVTTSVGPPAAPVANAATVLTSTAFTANWNGVTGATGYRLDVSSTNSFEHYVSGYQDAEAGNLVSLCVSGLNGDTTYFYRVRAYNTNGASASSGTIAVTLPQTTDYGCLTVSNAGFENGFGVAGGGTIANGWTEWEGLPTGTIGYDETVTVHGGLHSQRIRIQGVTNGPTAGGTYQRVPAVAGLAYSISVWTYAADALSVCHLGVDPAGGTNANSGTIWSPGNNSSSWQKRTWTGLAEADHLTIFLKVTAPTDTARRNGYFDDLITTEQRPQLVTAWNGPDLTLTWPDCPQARLEQAGSLTAPVGWTTVTNPISNLGGLNTVTLTPADGGAFFRLVLE